MAAEHSGKRRVVWEHGKVTMPTVTVVKFEKSIGVDGKACLWKLPEEVVAAVQAVAGNALLSVQLRTSCGQWPPFELPVCFRAVCLHCPCPLTASMMNLHLTEHATLDVDTSVSLWVSTFG